MLVGPERDSPKFGPKLLPPPLPTKTAAKLSIHLANINGTRENSTLNLAAGGSQSFLIRGDGGSGDHHNRKLTPIHETITMKQREIIEIMSTTYETTTTTINNDNNQSGSSRGQVRDLCDKIFKETIKHNNNNEKQQQQQMATLPYTNDKYHANKDDCSNKLSCKISRQDRDKKNGAQWLLSGCNGHLLECQPLGVLLFALITIILCANPTAISCFQTENYKLPSWLASDEIQNSLAGGGDSKIQAAPLAASLLLMQMVHPINHLAPKLNQSESILSNNNSGRIKADQVNNTLASVNNIQHGFGQRIGANLELEQQVAAGAPASNPNGSDLATPSSDNSSGLQTPLPASPYGEGEFGERATFSRLAELFPVSKRELIITKLIKQYRKARSQPATTTTTEQPVALGLKMMATSSGNLDIGQQADSVRTTIESTTETLPNYEEAPTTPTATSDSTSAPAAGNGTQLDYHLVKLQKPNESMLSNKTVSRLAPHNHRMDHSVDGSGVGEVSATEPLKTSRLYFNHHNPWLLLPASTRRHNRSPSHRQPHNHWQASNIEQVIHAGDEKKNAAAAASMESDSLGEQVGGSREEQNEGRNEAMAMGQRLRDHENGAHWSRDKHGEHRHLGAGRKLAKEGDKWVKDVGHKKHGWKNVYHKEEYANHQKYHDIILDKDWDNKKAKHSESYYNDKGERFNDSRSSDRYDKDKHGSKYDYVKGSNWKHHDEDGHYYGTDTNRLSKAESESEGVARKQQQQQKQRASGGGDYDAGGGPAMAASRRLPPKDQQNHFEPSPSISSMGGISSAQEDQVHPNANEDIDDAAIERMRDKLNKLSDTTRYTLDGGPEGGPDEQAPLASSNSSSYGFRGGGSGPTLPTGPTQTESPDYEPEDEQLSQQQPNNWTSYQSINDILKTAKNRGSFSGPVPVETNRPGPLRSAASSGAEPEAEGEDEESEAEPAAERQPTRSDGNSSRIVNSNKNGLRLKFELDLSKAIPTNLLPAAISSPQYELVNPQQQQQRPSQMVERAPRRAGNNSGSYHHRSYRNATSNGHLAPTRLANHQHYSSYPMRSAVRVEKANTLQVFGNQPPPASSSSSGQRFNAEDGNIIESVIPTRKPPASTSVNSPPRPWTPAGGGGHLRGISNRPWPSTSQQLQHQMQMPPLHRNLHNQQPARQTTNNYHPRPSYNRDQPTTRPTIVSSNFTGQGTLSALSHVLPNRPIFVKHLQMNGGIMLDTKPHHRHHDTNPFNNRSFPVLASRRQPSLIIPATSAGGEDLTIETSLSNAFGDIVTLPGGQQVQIHHHHRDTEGSMVEPEHASRDHQYHMVESAPPSFGGESFPAAAAAETSAGGRGSGSGSVSGSRDAPTEDPNGNGVIFEVAPGALDDDDVRPNFLADSSHHQTNDIESLLAGDDQQLLGDQSFGFGQSASAPSFVIDSTGDHATASTGTGGPFDVREKDVALDGSQLFKPALTVLLNHHHGGTTGVGLGSAQAAASIVIPAVQQTFARFLRFPRVFSQAYRQPQLPQFHYHHNQFHPQHQSQMQASQQQYITATQPFSPLDQQHFRFQPRQYASDRQLQQQRRHHHHRQSLPNQPHFHHPSHRRPPLAMQIGESRVGPTVGSGIHPSDADKWIRGPQQSSFMTHQGVAHKEPHDLALISSGDSRHPHLYPLAPEQDTFNAKPTEDRSVLHQKHLLNPAAPPLPGSQMVMEMNDLMGAASSKTISARALATHPGATATSSPVSLAYNSSSKLTPISSSLGLNKSTNSHDYVVSSPGQVYVSVGANYTIEDQRGQELPGRVKLKRPRQGRMQKGLILVAATERSPEAAATGNPGDNSTLSGATSASLSASFVAPQMHSNNNWIPSKGIEHLLQRPSYNMTHPTREATRNGRPPPTSSLQNRRPLQNLQQNHDQQQHQHQQQQHLSWPNLPYATMPSRQPIEMDTLASSSSSQKQNLRPLKVVRAHQGPGQMVGGNKLSSSQMIVAPPPTLAPKVMAEAHIRPSSTQAPSQTTANQMNQQFLISITTTSSTRVPFFGQRILANLKSKLNNVAG